MTAGESGKGDLGAFSALSFDCYGTLIDWEAGIGRELVQWARAHDVAASHAELVAAFGSVETHVQAEHPAMLYPQVLELVIMRIADHHHVGVTQEEAAAFGTSVGRWPAFADSTDALRRLASRRALIILSNVDRASFAASNRLLGVEFDVIVTAEDVGAYKPSARSFPALFDRLDRVGIDRSRMLHVAQSLYHDHEPARLVGLPSVWIDRRHADDGFGATPPPRGEVVPQWRYPSMTAFADAALGV